MKVKYICEIIETKDDEEIETNEITEICHVYNGKLIDGNIYECVGKNGDCYRIIDETKEEALYPMKDFRVIESNMFKVALLQIMPSDSLFENLQKGMGYCRKAKEMGADMVLFPEMWSNGYNIPEDVNVLKSKAVDKDSAFLRSFATLAKELEIAIGVTYLEAGSPSPRNSLVVFDRFGERVLDYAKVHTCDFGDEVRLTAGDDFYVCQLDTKNGKVNIGAMICYDREFPESARILMLKGAEIILVPNACPMEINRLSQLRARAFENMVGIATCNYPNGKPDCNGGSSAFDGVAYLPDMNGSRDTCILQAGGEEGVYMAEFDMDMIRNYRNIEVHGNTYRRPEKYKKLLDKTVNAPFIRSDKK